MHQKLNRMGRGSHFPNFQEIFAFFEENLAVSHFGPNQCLKFFCFGMKLRYEIFPHFTHIPQEFRYNFPLPAGIEKGGKTTTVNLI